MVLQLDEETIAILLKIAKEDIANDWHEATDADIDEYLAEIKDGLLDDPMGELVRFISIGFTPPEK